MDTEDELGALKARLLSTPEGRAAYERAQYCQRCAAHVKGREARKLCAAGTCTIWCCPECGYWRGSAGPIDCPACNGGIGFLIYHLGRTVGRLLRKWRS